MNSARNKERAYMAPKVDAVKKSESKIEVPREVEVQSKIEVAQEQTIVQMGTDIIRHTGELGAKYFTLCKFIRDNKVAPKLVSFALNKLGFKRSRISEVNRVANASDKLFKEYEAKLIGFDKCLDLSRLEDGKVKITPAAELLLKDKSVTAEDVKEASDAEQVPSGSATPAATPSQKIKAHAMAILKLASRPCQFRDKESSFIVIVQKLDKTGPAIGDDKNG